MPGIVTARLAEIVSYLHDYLRIDLVPDNPRAHNGLQVENSGSVSRLLAAVDASQASIDEGVRTESDLIVVHHGLFWGGPEPIIGRHGKRIRALIENDIALYAAHMPLDVHEDIGNNTLLARQLGISDATRFGDYEGIAIGIAGRLELSVDELAGKGGSLLGCRPVVIAKGPDMTSSVGVITGAGGSMIRDAVDAGIDTLITGEGAHHTFFDAEEWGVNLIYAGHYATETLGVKALARHLAGRYELEWVFFDHPTGL